MEHCDGVVHVLGVHDPRNDRSDHGAVFVCGRAVSEQTYRVCVIDRPLDDRDECLVARFHHCS
jgi:hypothetical protein